MLILMCKFFNNRKFKGKMALFSFYNLLFHSIFVKNYIDRLHYSLFLINYEVFLYITEMLFFNLLKLKIISKKKQGVNKN